MPMNLPGRRIRQHGCCLLLPGREEPPEPQHGGGERLLGKGDSSWSETNNLDTQECRGPMEKIPRVATVSPPIVGESAQIETEYAYRLSLRQSVGHILGSSNNQLASTGYADSYVAMHDNPSFSLLRGRHLFSSPDCHLQPRQSGLPSTPYRCVTGVWTCVSPSPAAAPDRQRGPSRGRQAKRRTQRR